MKSNETTTNYKKNVNYKAIDSFQRKILRTASMNIKSVKELSKEKVYEIKQAKSWSQSVKVWNGKNKLNEK